METKSKGTKETVIQKKVVSHEGTVQLDSTKEEPKIDEVTIDKITIEEINMKFGHLRER